MPNRVFSSAGNDSVALSSCFSKVETDKGENKIFYFYEDGEITRSYGAEGRPFKEHVIDVKNGDDWEKIVNSTSSANLAAVSYAKGEEIRLYYISEPDRIIKELCWSANYMGRNWYHGDFDKLGLTMGDPGAWTAIVDSSVQPAALKVFFCDKRIPKVMYTELGKGWTGNAKAVFWGDATANESRE